LHFNGLDILNLASGFEALPGRIFAPSPIFTDLF